MPNLSETAVVVIVIAISLLAVLIMGRLSNRSAYRRRDSEIEIGKDDDPT
jgi:hypothetical protein